MNRIKRRFRSFINDKLESLEYLLMDMDDLYSDPKGYFISNLIPSAIRHYKTTIVLIMAITFLVEILSSSSWDNFTLAHTIFAYPFLVILTAIILTLITFTLAIIESFAKLFSSLILYKTPYTNGTILDTALASFFTEEDFLDAMYSHSRRKHLHNRK